MGLGWRLATVLSLILNAKRIMPLFIPSHDSHHSMKKPTALPDFNSVATLWQPFLYFLLPLLFTNILQSLSGTINTIFVGQLLGVKAVAAISVFAPILFFLLAFIIGIASGSSVLIGQAWGAKDHDLVKRITGNSFAIILILGIIIAILGSVFSEWIILHIGVPSDIQALATRYTRLMLAGSPLLFLFIAYTSLMRGVGDSVTPLLAVGISIVIGLLVTPAFIQGWFGLPQLGILAPAIATLLSQFLVLVYLYFYTGYKHHPLELDKVLLSYLRIQPDIAGKVIRLGLPTAFQMVTGAISGIVIIGLINGFGTNATAAYGAVNQVLNYVQFPAISIAIAASIFASQAIGKGETTALNSVTRTALLLNFIITGSLIGLAYLFSRYLMALFITDGDVIVMSQHLLHIVLWSILFFSSGMIFSGMMRATGMVWQPMFISIASILLVELPCAFFLSHRFGLEGIWWAYVANFIVMSALQGLYYQFIWKKKAVKKLI